MQRIPQIKAVMTPFPYSIGIDETVGTAKEMMSRHGIRHLPVIEGNELVSVITDADVRVALQPWTESPSQPDARIRDICVRETYVVELTEPLDQVLLHMARHHIGSALVVKDKKLAGIFTITDACRAFGLLLQTLFPSKGDDHVA